MLKNRLRKFKLLYLLLLHVFGFSCSAQVAQRPSLTGARLTNTLSLPFRDDFSGTKIVPDPALWLDSNVYINSDFPLNPISIGVATFDGSDKKGRPHQSLLKKSYGVADYLTSKPINLFDNAGLRYTPADSIYLSFYYQPQGLGDAPDGADSLVVEFRAAKSVNDTLWQHAWSKEGSPAKPFKAVILPITDTLWLKNNFQFRFKNYTTYSGNLDHWSIDYVVVDAKRNRKDTVINEITWVERAPSSLLKNYRSMPWKHFLGHEATELIGSFDIRVRNNSTSPFTTFYSLDVKNEKGDTTAFYPGRNDKGIAVSPPANSYYNLTANSLINPFPDNGKDSATFTFEKVLSGSSSDMFPANDALIEKINFFNYYAYDDGTAEGGYGLTESGGKIAMQFNLTKPDTIQAVSFYFNQMAKDVSGSTFKITIWDNLAKDHILYQSADVTPIYENTINGFHTYKLDKPFFASGTIYVGWVQNTQLLLNLGMDKNTNISRDLMQYFIPSVGVWNATVYSGAWMVRPVVGKKLPLVLGQKELASNANRRFAVYPNPADHTIYFQLADNLNPIDPSNLVCSFTDGIGRVLVSTQRIENINIADFAPGLYFLKIESPQQGILETHKIIISR